MVRGIIHTCFTTKHKSTCLKKELAQGASHPRKGIGQRLHGERRFPNNNNKNGLTVQVGGHEVPPAWATAPQRAMIILLTTT